MKTRNTLIIATLGLISFEGICQNATDIYQTITDEVHVVVLNLNGQARINPVSGNQLSIESNLTSKGDVWGIKREKNRPLFETTAMRSSDTLYVSTPKLFSYKSVGINTYTEKIENTISIPDFLEIIVMHAHEVEIEPGFSSIDIKNARSVDIDGLAKNMIKLLCCSSQTNLTVNGKRRGYSYEFEGLGRESYYLNATKIDLNIK